MGWWKQGDDLLGDGPVDVLESGLKELSAQGTIPTWQEFADAVAGAISELPDDTLSDGATQQKRKSIYFEFREGPKLASAGDRGDPVLRRELAEIIKGISEEYLEHRGRTPTVSELLSTISFSLGVRPERFLSGAEGTSLSRISLRGMS